MRDRAPSNIFDVSECNHYPQLNDLSTEDDNQVLMAVSVTCNIGVLQFKSNDATSTLVECVDSTGVTSTPVNGQCATPIGIFLVSKTLMTDPDSGLSGFVFPDSVELTIDTGAPANTDYSADISLCMSVRLCIVHSQFFTVGSLTTCVFVTDFPSIDN